MRILTRKSKKKSTRNLSFMLFTELPPELRIQIWVFSLPKGRIVGLEQYYQWIPRPIQRSGTSASSIHEIQHTTSTSQANDQESVVVYRSQTHVPTIYAVCRESRAVVEQFYTKAFGTENSPGTWIDFRTDALYLPRELCEYGSGFYETFWKDIKQVKSLAISGIWSPYSEDPSPLHQLDTVNDISEALAKFGNLEWLMLVDAQHEPGQTADLGWIPGKSAEEYEKWLRQWAHPAYCIGQYLWPCFLFGTFIDDSDGSGRWHEELRRKAHAWKEMFRSMLSTRWRFSRSSP
ncbi:hypothetical protein B0O99DRAFT_606892 [Bisporella sp. PMI_857]|nr:hypothetical protein B0O99DRAFT_606892 [Bisporella sp. PMI_857]